MSLKEKILPVLARLRAFNATKMGLRPFVAYVRRTVPDDARDGVGATLTVTDTQLTERVKVREASTRDVTRSGGTIQIADWLLTLSTPRNALNTTGTPLAELDFAPSVPGEKVFIVLDGPGFPAYSAGEGGKEFTIVDVDNSGNFQWTATLRPRT